MIITLDASCLRNQFRAANVWRVCHLIWIAVWLGTAPSAAQSAHSYQIQGRVVDGETGVAVSDAAIKVFALSVVEGVLKGARTGKGEGAEPHRSDLSGKFSVPVPGPARYSITAQREGYIARNNSVAVISEENPSATVRLEAFRAAAITGRVLDAENKRPLQGITVVDLKCFFRRGEKSLHSLQSAVTDEDGGFRLEGLLPGEHVLLLQSQAADFTASPATGKPAAISPKAGDNVPVYRALWPADGKGAMGVSVVGGAENAFGDIIIERRELSTVRGVVRSNQCNEADKVEVWLVDAVERGTRFNVAGGLQQCGAPWVISQVPPGQYQIEAWIEGRAGKSQRHYFGEISLAEKQALDVELDLMPPMVMPVTLSDSSGNPYVPDAGVTIEALPVNAAPFAEEVIQKIPIDGRGDLIVFFRGEIDLQISGLRRNEYVKELRYNGSGGSGTRFMPNPAAVSNKLEIIVGADAAFVSPALADQKNATVDTKIVIAPWPPRMRGMIPDHVIVERRDDGSFTSVWMPPGKYRAFAIALPDAFIRLDRPIDKPGVLFSALSDSDDIAVSPGETRQLRVKFTRLE